MKRVLILIYVVTLTSLTFAGNPPAWVKAKPVDNDYYIGISSALTTEKNFQQVARDKALGDLIGEINIEIESSSLLNRQEIDEQYSESFRQDIKSTAVAQLEGHEMVDSYNDGERYWVYYRLNKAEYEKLMQKRLSDAINQAYGYWVKGLQAEKAGQLVDAMDLYLSGLSTIEEYANRRLPVDHQGKSTDVGIELYTSLKLLFFDLTIRTNPQKITAQSFSKEPSLVQIQILRGETPAVGLPLKARFSIGEGSVSLDSKTQNDGSATLTLTNITSKLAYQEIELRVDVKVPSHFNTSFMKQLTDDLFDHIPVIKLPVEVEQSPLKVILYTKDHDTNTSLLNMISSYLNDYFDIVSDRESADLSIWVTPSIRKGGIVKSEMYDLYEIFASCDLTITDLATGNIVANFGLQDVRSLVPENSSNSKIRSTAQRDLFKKLRPVIERNLQKAHFSRKAQSATDLSPEDYDDTSMPEIIE